MKKELKLKTTNDSHQFQIPDSVNKNLALWLQINILKCKALPSGIASKGSKTRTDQWN